MDAKVVTCGYVFTKQEFRRVLSAFWLETARGWLLLSLFPIIIVMGTGVSVYGDLTSPETSGHLPSHAWAVANDVGSAVFALIFVSVLVWYVTTRAFVKGVLFNSPMNFTVREESLHLRSQMLDTTLQWSALRKFKNTKKGFLVFLLGSRSFYWLPFDGFESRDDIAWMRELLARKTKK